MRERLRAMISKRSADFADIRYEIRKQTVISFSGKEIKQVNASATDGYVVRARSGTGFSSA
ncbi:MAG TPA: DNA gyrase modulator, partial [Candidatus Fermentibacter sp.]|nr:DNA gyrase modulator [Candidatus Fermentibacter sp.]